MDIKLNLVETHIVKKVGDNYKYLLLKRSPYEKYPNIWQMVTGSVKRGEKAYETAIRELKEETNFSPEKMFVVPTINSFYNEENDSIYLIPVFLAIVNPEQKVLLSSEHVEYRWESFEDAKAYLAWPGQRKSVDIIKKYLFDNDKSLNFIEINLDITC